MRSYITAEMATTAARSQVQGFLDYISIVAPAIHGNRVATEQFVEGSVLLLTARLESLLGTLVVTAAHEREEKLRSYLEECAEPVKKPRIQAMSRRELIALGKSRLKLSGAGRKISALSEALWGFEPWADEGTRADLIDLNLLRQLVAHRNGGEAGSDYYQQLCRRELLQSREYVGLPAVRTLDYSACLLFLTPAVAAMLRQALHLRQQFRRVAASDVR